MAETRHEASFPNPIEQDIIKCFGWAILVTETLLYERFLQISAKRSVTTPDLFRNQLLEMVAKGFLSSENLHGKRAYRLLIVPEESDERTRPQAPLDEMKLVVGSLAARLKRAKEDRMTSKKDAGM